MAGVASSDVKIFSNKNARNETLLRSVYFIIKARIKPDIKQLICISGQNFYFAILNSGTIWGHSSAGVAHISKLFIKLLIVAKVLIRNF